MKDVNELGKIVKQLKPGRYDDIPDQELGLIYKGQHPGKYDDFVDADDSLDVMIGQVETLISHYDPDLGRIRAWWRRGKSEGRVKLLASLDEELRLFGSLVSKREAFLGVKAHRELAELMHKNVVLELATKYGIPPALYQQMVLNQFELDKEILRAEIDKDKISHGYREQAKYAMLAEIVKSREELKRLKAEKAKQHIIDAAKEHIKEMEQLWEKTFLKNSTEEPSMKYLNSPKSNNP